MSYGLDVPQNFRRAAYFMDRILKGEHAGDLPIEVSIKLELVLNLKTAKTLGIERVFDHRGMWLATLISSPKRRAADRHRSPSCLANVVIIVGDAGVSVRHCTLAIPASRV